MHKFGSCFFFDVLNGTIRYKSFVFLAHTGGPETVTPAAESPLGSCPAGGEHHQWTFGASQLPGDAAARSQRLPHVEWRGTTRLEPSDGRRRSGSLKPLFGKVP